MNEKLKNIVEESYLLFGKYRANLPLDVCTECCMTKSQETELVSLDVKQIPFELLYEYNTAAKTAHPDLEEFKHFLPRFIELTSELKLLHHSAELVLNRFDYYKESDWSGDEKELLQLFAEELFEYVLSVYPIPESERIDAVLIMLAKTNVDILKVLNRWGSVKSHSSVLHYNGFSGDTHPKLSSPFADEALSSKVSNWLKEAYSLVELEPQIEDIIMNSKEIGEWKLNELNWTYIKLNELKYKLETLN
jgi:hypothetical protein